LNDKLGDDWGHYTKCPNLAFFNAWLEAISATLWIWMTYHWSMDKELDWGVLYFL
jgi:hypothetical protein